MTVKEPRNLLRFEVQVVEHCNLKCINCNHFSPLAQEEFLDVSGYAKDLERLSELFGSEVEFINLMGGEPLLHPQIKEIMMITRKYFKLGQVRLVTNGLLLSEMQQEFWDICHTYDIELYITKYPLSLDYLSYERKASENGIQLVYYNDICNTERRMLRMPIDIKGDFDPIENFRRCEWGNFWITLCGNGKLYTCTKAACARHLKQYFGFDLELSEQNSVDIYKVKSADELMRKLAEPIPFCKYCDLAAWIGYEDNWQVSNKDRYEWVSFVYSEDDISYLKNANTVYVFGAGVRGSEVVRKLVSKGVQIKAVLVSSKKNNVDFIGDIPVVSLDSIAKPKKEDVCILGINELQTKIEVQEILYKKGFKKLIPLLHEEA